MESLQRKDQLFLLTLSWKKCFFPIFATEKWAITVYPRREKLQLVFPGQEKLEVVQRSNGKRPFYPAKNQQKAIFVSPYMGLNQIQTTHVALWIRLQTSESNELPTTLRNILIMHRHTSNLSLSLPQSARVLQQTGLTWLTRFIGNCTWVIH